jgi:hypothetical protein
MEVPVISGGIAAEVKLLLRTQNVIPLHFTATTPPNYLALMEPPADRERFIALIDSALAGKVHLLESTTEAYNMIS